MTQDSFWRSNPRDMIIRAHGLGQLAERLEAEQIDGAWNDGTFVAFPVLLALAAEIGLKAWYRIEGNPGPKTHDLLKLFDGLGENTQTRLDVAYIRGPMRLWYIKRRLANSSIVERYPLTITFAAMHRMSELSRYEPITLNRYLESRQNYLLSEFIENAPLQFVDEIASEITGQEFMPPGIRTAGR